MDTAIEYLSSNAAQIRDVHLWDKTWRTGIMVAAHAVFQFALVDKLADAAGLPLSRNYRTVPRSPTPDLGGTMTKVRFHNLTVHPPSSIQQLMSTIANWTKPISKIRQMCKKLRTSTPQQSGQPLQVIRAQQDNIHTSRVLDTSHGPFAVDFPTNMTPAQKDVCSSFQILLRATNHHQSSELNQVLLNMELLAFSFGWFAQVCFSCLAFSDGTLHSLVGLPMHRRRQQAVGGNAAKVKFTLVFCAEFDSHISK
jgi:hypothetical protein